MSLVILGVFVSPPGQVVSVDIWGSGKSKERVVEGKATVKGTAHCLGVARSLSSPSRGLWVNPMKWQVFSVIHVAN